MPNMRKYHLFPFLLTIFLLFFILFQSLLPLPRGMVYAQTPAESADCADVRFLMAQELTPTPGSLFTGGGILNNNQPVQGGVTASDVGDHWVMPLTRPTDTRGSAQRAQFSLNFTNISGGLELEFQVFLGMNALTGDNGIEGYQPVIANSPYTYSTNSDGNYTVVVQRRSYAAVEQTGSYQLTVSGNFTGNTQVVDNEIPDNFNNQRFRPDVVDGKARITFPNPNGSVVWINTGGATSISSTRGDVEVRFDNGITRLAGWVEKATFLGGSFAMEGTLPDGTQRFLYIEGYGHRTTIDLINTAATNFADSNNNRLRTDWSNVTGFWLLANCVGVKLIDGRTFVAPVTGDRALTFGELPNELTGCDRYDITVDAPEPDGSVTNHKVCLNWDGIAANSELLLENSVLKADLVGERQLRVQSVDIDLLRATETEGTPENARLDVRLNDQAVALAFDWVNLQSFGLLNEQIELAFLDTPRTTTTRPGANLLSVEALEDVIHIVYKPDGNTPGEQRLLLPAAESYVELITPAGEPTFTGRALPGEAGYAPRALNNTGTECYPLAALTEANCPPNGYPNPANGNLFYAVTDHHAAGGEIDLTLTRSYNSLLASFDGPFGRGWVSPYMVDFSTAFDAVQNARVIEPDVIAAEGSAPVRYRVGLDLTWAARGIVTFTTPSGARHVFTQDSSTFISGELTALTMPGWKLARASLRSGWQLSTDTGLVYEFDRAGRIVRYGFPARSRWVEVQYPRTELNGPGGIDPETPVIITDAASLRQIELYFDADHHVYRSRLRDLTLSATGEDCSPAQNCFETFYTYENGFLVAVDYPEQTGARYDYDESGRLLYHDDPRAPLYQTMTYSYHADGTLNTINVLPAGETAAAPAARVWRILSPAALDTNRERRTVEVTDEHGNLSTFAYRWEVGDLRSALDTFTLAQTTGPLAAAGGFDAQATEYAWDNGLLTSINTVTFAPNAGRSGVTFTYTNGDGKLSGVTGGYSPLTVTYEPPADAAAAARAPRSATFANGARAQYLFNADNPSLLEAYTDPNGAAYQYFYDELGRLERIERTNDSLAWRYEYNEAGLVTAMRQSTPLDADTSTQHIINYTYDGLGRLTAVRDSALGDYQIAYATPATEASATSEITVTDPVGSVTIWRFDARSRLIETRLLATDAETYLRRTTYNYNDPLERLTAEHRWLLDGDGNESALTTTYLYEEVSELAGLVGDEAPTFIGGTRITVVDAYGRAAAYTYDALDRLRQVEDIYLNRTRYDYSVQDTENSFGFRIQQRDLTGGRIVRQIDYRFDGRWLLRSVTRTEFGTNEETNTVRWDIAYPGDTSNIRAIEMRDNNTTDGAVLMGDYTNGHLTTVQLDQAPAALANPTLSVPVSDFLNRPVRVTDGAGISYALAYCPLPGGQVREVLSLPDTNEIGCDSADFARALQYDLHRRLVQVDDEYGTRLFVYFPDPATGLWEIETRAYSTRITAESAGTPDFTWRLHYNAAGDLIRWIDDAGIEHNYTYDTLGRLIRAESAGNPEASYTFSYNAADQLTSALNDLGSGTLYGYNALGQLIVQQDARTSDATAYTYGTNNQLKTVISPLGNTTTYLYDDSFDPNRLTGIIDATGSVHRFTWDSSANTVTYTGPRGNITVYTFDNLGGLSTIQDGDGRQHELTFDGAGYITSWGQTRTSGTQFTQQLTLALPEPATGTYQLGSAQIANWGWQYDLLPGGRLDRLTNPAGQPIDFNYDAFGRVNEIIAGERVWSLPRQDQDAEIAYTDGFGNSTTLTFDLFYRLLTTTATDDAVAYTYTPDPATGAIDLEIREPYSTRTYRLSPGDAFTPPRIILSAPGQRVTYWFGAERLLAEIVTETCMDLTLITPEDPLGCLDVQENVRTTFVAFEYDAERRPIRVIDEEQNIEIFSYDDAGNLITYQNANGKSFNYAYDSLNRLVRLSGPAGIQLLLAYEGLDNVAGICRTRAEQSAATYEDCVESGGLLEAYTYDALGRLTGQNYPNGSELEDDELVALTYAYEAPGAGLLTERALQGNTTRRIYDDNGLGLLTQLLSDSSEYEFDYQTLSRLQEIGGTAPVQVTDEQGRLSEIRAGDHTLLFTYESDNSGYTITDQSSGAALHLKLDARGYLASIDYAATASALTPDAPQVTINSTQGGDRVLAVEVLWQNGDITELLLNQRGEAQNVFHLNPEVLLNYVTQPRGEVQRQSISGAPEYFVDEVEGYVVVVGYDDDERPITLRVSNQQDGQLLYTLAFTYNALGQRDSETRQYANGVQVTISYRYDQNTGQQLVQRVVEVIYPRQTLVAEETVEGFAPLFALGALLVVVVRYRRRGLIALLILAMIAAFGFAALQPQTSPNAQAQGNRVTFTYTYTYNAAGNLSRVDVEAYGGTLSCGSFTYDSAQRLTTAALNAGNNQTLNFEYQYDAYNRIVEMSGVQLVYADDSTVPTFVQDQRGAHLYGQTPANGFSFFDGVGATVVRLVSDGQGSVLAALALEENSQPEPIWLHDPVGRYVSLTPPAPDLLTAAPNACQIFDVPTATMRQTLPPHTVIPNMIWHAEANLFFMDGRAYLPDIGRFLQRNPSGPDAFGNVYEFPTSQTQPPVRRMSHPAYSDGLFLLREAQQTRALGDTLSAGALLQTFAPAVAGQFTPPFIAGLDDAVGRVRAEMSRLLNLNEWLNTVYNLPGPTFDAQGLLQVVPDTAPAQAGRPAPALYAFDTPLWQSDHWMPSPVTLPAARLAQAIAPATPPTVRFALYEPLSWQPRIGSSLHAISDGWQPLAPDFSAAPSAVLEWLPNQFTGAEQAATTMEIIEQMQAAPQQRGADWVQVMLDGALPALPTLMPMDAQGWLANWFTLDTFGTQSLLNPTGDLPGLPRPPRYGLGNNKDWIFPLQGRDSGN